MRRWQPNGTALCPSRMLLGRRWRGLAQRLGESFKDPVCWQFAGDAPRPFLHDRHVFRAVARGDIAVDLHRHYGVEFWMIEEVGVVTGYLAVVPYPPVVLTEPDAVGQVAFQRRLVERRHVADERVEPLGLL